MPPARTHNRRPACLVCGAGEGQIVPFCEWCGARHSTISGALVLTGAICQGCGFQSDMAFSRCPRCRAERRVLCPACGTALPVRRPCGNCGLHFAFFDQMRRRLNQPRLPGRASRSVTGRKLVFMALILAAAAVLASGGAPYRPAALAILAATLLFAATGMWLNRRAPNPRGWRRRGMLPVLETEDPGEAAAACAELRRSGIRTLGVTVDSRLAKGGGRHCVMVAAGDLKPARNCLFEYGFEVDLSPRVHSLRRRLRLVERRSRESEAKAVDHD